MDGVFDRGWELILHVYGGTSALVKSAILTARWLHELQPVITQGSWRFHTLWGGIIRGNCLLVPSLLES